MPQTQFSQVLPASWDGRFPFTNTSDEDFDFTWAKRVYRFPAHRTIDMMKLGIDASPLQIQQIRKFAAERFAEREFLKTEKAKRLQSLEKDEHGYSKMFDFRSSPGYSKEDPEFLALVQKVLASEPEGDALMAPAKVRDTVAELKDRQMRTGGDMTKPVKDSATTLERGDNFASPDA